MPVAGMNSVSFTAQICIHEIPTEVGGGRSPPTVPWLRYWLCIIATINWSCIFRFRCREI